MLLNSDAFACLVNTEESIQNFVSSLGNGITIADSTNDNGIEMSLKDNFAEIGGVEDTHTSTSFTITSIQFISYWHSQS